MTKPIAIKIEGLSKQFRSSNVQKKTLRETLDLGLRKIFRLEKRKPHGPTALTNQKWVLKDISFEVGQGEVVGILGKNGSGKSTLLKILAQLIVPTSGRAEIAGKVGLLNSFSPMQPTLRGRDNLYLGGVMLGMSFKEVRARSSEIAAYAELENALDNIAAFYSRGMSSRLAFSLGIHSQSDILLMDEVLSVSDRSFQKKAIERTLQLAAAGITVIIVSHDMRIIEECCTRAIFLDEGRIVADGEVSKVSEIYQDFFK